MAAELVDLVQRGQFHVLEDERAERHLKHFVRQAWHVVEPATPYIHNWHIDALCDHLQACLRGEIRNLLVTMPPRAMKSLTISVFFPAWAWIHRPDLRFLYASYAQSLAIEHSMATRRVIESDWYQARWGDRFSMAEDDNLKTRFSNDQRGYRLATSVGAAVTGFGGDVVLCLPADEYVWTEHGKMMIGPLVWDRRDIRVWSQNPLSGEMELKPVVGWHENPGTEIVELGLSDGSLLRCTRDHRILTVNRGWVEAGRLRPSDMLPDFPLSDCLNECLVDTELPSEFTGRSRRFEDDMNVVFSQLSAMAEAVGGEPDIFGDADPCQSVPDLLNGSSLDTVSGCERIGGLSAGGDLSGLLSGENGARTALVDREGSVALGVVDVLGASSILQIGERSICAIPVAVADLLAFWTGTDECSHDSLMDEHLDGSPVLSDIESRVSLSGWGLEDPVGDRERLAVSLGSAPVTSDASEAGHTVEAIKSRYRSPLFVRHHSYAPATYCITVADHHNFLAGDKIIVANCDDPHNVQQAESDAIRQSTLTWWDQAMSTRLNNPRTGVRIIVMQRVHEDDLAGHVASDPAWTHLNLPMEYEPTTYVSPIGWSDPRTVDGELLWPERMDQTFVETQKRTLGSYAYAGQYQQRPAPAEGGILKAHWFGRYVEPHSHYTHIIQAWDTAFKTTDGADYSACVTLAVGPYGFDILDVFHAKLEFPDLERAVQTQHLVWSSRYPGVPFSVLVEDKASGQSLIQSARRWVGGNINIIPVPVPAKLDKERRVHEVSPVIEAGRVRLPTDPDRYPWLEPSLHEWTTFPLVKHDDVTDAFAIAVRRAAGIGAQNAPATDQSAFAPAPESRRERASRHRRMRP